MFDIDIFDALIETVAVIALTVSGWIVTKQVRRRMKISLGRKPADLELASLKTWMTVEEAEQQEKENGPIHPGRANLIEPNLSRQSLSPARRGQQRKQRRK